MRIVGFEVRRVPLTLVAPYTIAYETVERAENLFVRLVTDGPHVGLGCAAPDAGVTGETHDACDAALRAAADQLRGLDPLRTEHCLEQLVDATRGCPAARAAVDAALWDHLGKVAGLPVWQLLGGYRTEVETAITLFLDTPDVMVRQARERAREGFRILKLKGGREVDVDLEVLARVREAVGPDLRLWFDANQGWTKDQALRFVAEAEAYDLELVEQPTRRGAQDALAGVTRAAAMTVGADESLHGVDDAFRLARHDVVDLVNIKLMKVGGIDAALNVEAVADAAGIDVMIGCMDESALGIAAGLHLALARRRIRYADLDGHLDLVADPAEGAVLLDRGVLRPADGPGFGLVDLE